MHKRTTFQVAATYVGAVMGAGFASGQEIQQFFVRFGRWGLVGIAISALLFALLGWVMIDLQERWRVADYTVFFQGLFGQRLGRVLDWLVSALLLVGMVAMVSAGGALFYEFFGQPRWLGVVLTAGLMVLALWFRGEGVLWINSALIPLKFLFCLGIGLAAAFFAHPGEGEGLPVHQSHLVNHWLLSGVLYVSFNLTLAMVVFASLGKEVRQRGARTGAAVGGIALGAFAWVIGAALLRFPEVNGLEIPMVAVAGKLGDWPAFFYAGVLWLALTTAAIGNAFSLTSRMVATGRVSYAAALTLLVAVSAAFAGVKFSHFVGFVYPLFGYIGLAVLPALIYRWLKS
ncbi:hypothetical protein CEB3_c41220 [Peptococcaceae bacterium CEB3]|nr:hypothetical protein CEB3_c41220 [Peptococcaceae bacterium CEB3]